MSFELSCPIPLEADTVRLAHGGGGRAMQRLLDGLFLPAFASEALERRHDASVLPVGGARLAFTTDSYVITPYFFPGGDIGSLAVHGTVNDLAMAGARPLYLSAGFVLEEGLPLEHLRRVAASMARAAAECGVQIVTGDTKVVDRGKGDGLYVNTAGIGVVEHDLSIAPSSVQPGDVIVVSGDLGRHGIALMACREGLEFETRLETDSAPLWGLVSALLTARVELHCLRDLTRGGLASALVEIAETSGRLLVVDEAAVPVAEEVRGACELLGLDPLYVANEGRMVAFLPASQREVALSVLEDLGASPAVVGFVDAAPSRGSVRLRTPLGVDRPLDMLSGEQLPRIC